MTGTVDRFSAKIMRYFFKSILSRHSLHSNLSKFHTVNAKCCNLMAVSIDVLVNNFLHNWHGKEHLFSVYDLSVLLQCHQLASEFFC